MASKPRVFPCNTCSITFTTSELQRSHMRQPWHVNNLRRRIAEQPALSEEQYNIEDPAQNSIQRQENDTNKSSHRQSPIPTIMVESITPASKATPKPRDNESTKIPPTQCLFCPLTSPTLPENLTHMFTHHGLFIPLQDHVTDVSSFLSYLAVIIFKYNECLYCGLEKGTVDSVQTHMRDKGHCMINMEKESELLDFWEVSDTSDEEDGGYGIEEDEEEQVEAKGTVRKGNPTKLSNTEMRLPSGAIINSRTHATPLRARASKPKPSQETIKNAKNTQAVTSGEDYPNPKPSTSKHSPINSNKNKNNADHRIAIRGELGLIGLSNEQKRALQITEKKMKRREVLSKATFRHAMEQQPKKTVYYKTENPVYQAG